jgi:hypothetical protein
MPISGKVRGINMKINQEDLKKLYLSLAKNQTNNDTSCPEADELIGAFTDEAGSKYKSRIVDHISKCNRCLEKFQIIRDFFKQGNQLAKDMEGQSLSREELSQLKEIQKDKLSIPRKNPLKLKFLAAAAMLLLIVGTVLLVQTGKDSTDNILRGTVEREFSLIAPKDEINNKFVIFKWKSMKGVRGYQVDLYDEELTCIWKSPVTEKTFLKLPSNIFQNLTKKKIYYWKLISFQSETDFRESGLQKFSIE